MLVAILDFYSNLIPLWSLMMFGVLRHVLTCSSLELQHIQSLRLLEAKDEAILLLPFDL